MKNTGFNVQGSDLNNNKNTDRLKKLGIKIYLGHSKRNLENATIVVLSSAIKNNNKELIASKKKKLPMIIMFSMKSRRQYHRQFH